MPLTRPALNRARRRAPRAVLGALLGTATLVAGCAPEREAVEACRDARRVAPEPALQHVPRRLPVSPTLVTELSFWASHPARSAEDSAWFSRVRATVDSVWRSDSVETARALAWLIVNDAASNRVVAENAAVQYRRLWARTVPILPLAAEYAATEQRRELALYSIASPLNPEEEEVVFSMACDAARSLRPFRSEEPRLLQLDIPQRWYAAAQAELNEAARLLGGKRAAAVRELLAAYRSAPDRHTRRP